MISAVDAREGTRVPPPAGAAHPLVASAAGRRPSPRAIARARRSLVDALGAAQVIDDPEAVVAAIFDHYEARGFGPPPEEHELLLNL